MKSSPTVVPTIKSKMPATPVPSPANPLQTKDVRPPQFNDVDIMEKPYAGLDASPRHPELPVVGLLASAVRLNVLPFHVTRKSVNRGVVES
jgi:hypothetical protein